MEMKTWDLFSLIVCPSGHPRLYYFLQNSFYDLGVKDAQRTSCCSDWFTVLPMSSKTHKQVLLSIPCQKESEKQVILKSVSQLQQMIAC